MENQAGRLVPALFLFFKKALYRIKTIGQHLSFNVLVDLDLDIQEKQIYAVDTDIYAQF